MTTHPSVFFPVSSPQDHTNSHAHQCQAPEVPAFSSALPSLPRYLFPLSFCRKSSEAMLVLVSQAGCLSSEGR